ncbi:MAG: hypothetical protein M1832_001406 [Thelocarpon impressellum]|nr:MAG: hypothetical protein M1832_001406 [Thelocarpon impressellum]
MVADLERKVFGEASEKVYNDWDGIGEIWSLPDHAPHHGVEKLVLAAGTEHGDKVRTAIVSPPMIYAPGRGPGNQRSYQLPELVRHTLERGKGFQIGAGKTYWNHVHVRDLSRLFLRLVEEAAKGGGEATWGKDGYYFAESGELVWGHISERVAVEARKQGFIKTDDVDSVDAGEDDKLSPIHFALWGANSRSRAERVRKLLGWVPKEKRPEDEIPEQIQIEAKRLGLVPGHAKKAAGEA